MSFIVWCFQTYRKFIQFIKSVLICGKLILADFCLPYVQKNFANDLSIEKNKLKKSSTGDIIGSDPIKGERNQSKENNN